MYGCKPNDSNRPSRARFHRGYIAVCVPVAAMNLNDMEEVAARYHEDIVLVSRVLAYQAALKNKIFPSVEYAKDFSRYFEDEAAKYIAVLAE